MNKEFKNKLKAKFASIEAANANRKFSKLLNECIDKTVIEYNATEKEKIHREKLNLN